MKEKEQVAKCNKEYFHNFWIDQYPKFAYPIDLPENLDDDLLSIIKKNEATNFWEQLVSSNFFNRFDSSQSKSLIKENLIKKMGFEEQIAVKLASCLQSYKLLVYEFYQQFFNQYVEQQIRKLQLNLENINFSTFFKDVEAFSIRLSTLFMNNQETGVEYHQKGIINKMTTIDNYYELFDENDQQIIDKKMCSSVDQRELYQFYTQINIGIFVRKIQHSDSKVNSPCQHNNQLGFDIICIQLKI